MQVLSNEGSFDIKMWTNDLPVEDSAMVQLQNIAKLPIIFRHLAVMPDVHMGYGAAVGSVVPTINAIIPSAVGVDIGCGMSAVKTTLTAKDLPDSLVEMRTAIEAAVPHGRTLSRTCKIDRGAWGEIPVGDITNTWRYMLEPGFNDICEKHPFLRKTNNVKHLGTLGTGNHFIEVCLDTEDNVWVMLHSGSRGVGNSIGTYFINMAKEEALRNNVHLPDNDLAYLEKTSPLFADYVEAVSWAQDFARYNRNIMMVKVLHTLAEFVCPFKVLDTAVNCHHNYVELEHHFGQDVYVTRKGAVSAKAGELGIIPGSMGARSFIVRGLGNPESFNSCSHGAGRIMSRSEAKRRFSVEDQVRSTEGVECRKDADVIDEIPMAYKDIDKVMAAQSDLVEIVATLKQVLCVKG